MAGYEHKVFISYAWGEETSEREAIVNQIDQSLQKRGLKIVRDKRDLGYKGSIRKFMERIGEGDGVIVIISDKYLRSKNCMFELVEIAENKQFADRIFPIVLSDAKIYDAADRVDYIAHWDNEKEKLNEKYGTLKDKSNTEGILEQLSDYDRFGDEIDGLTRILKDMNTLTPDMHRDSDFSDLFTAIDKRMRNAEANPGPVIQGTKQSSMVPSERKPIPVGVMAGAAGALLVIAIIIFSVLGNRGANASPTPAPTQASAVAEPATAVPTLTVAPSQTAVGPTVTEEAAPAATSTPTNTPEPTIEPTATPAPISMNCIHEQVWKPASTDQNTLDGISVNSNGCYSMEALGIFTDSSGTLHLNNRGQRNAITSGIYTPITNSSVIEFKIFVTGMFIVNLPPNPVIVNFAVAPLDDVLTARSSARFKLQVETNDRRPIIYFVLADVNENTGTKLGTQHYEYGRTYTIRLEVVGNSVRVYINGRKLAEELLIPTGQKAFYIGYTLPIAAGVDAEVKDITIDGVAK